jgi:hypothetical protein
MKNVWAAGVAGALISAALAGSANGAMVVTYGAPGATTASASILSNLTGGVETFDSQTGPNFVSNFGGSDVTGAYAGVTINPADQYGGAGGSGNYALALDAGEPASYSVALSTTGQSINYFGFWLSAADTSNTVTVTTNQGTYVFTGAEVLDAIAARSDAAAYLGNPSGPFGGQNDGQDYVFVNFFDTTVGDSIKNIVFSQNVGYAGFESDNQTVGHYLGAITGFSVPEPATWALMLVGVAGLGGLTRLRRAKGLAIV